METIQITTNLNFEVPYLPSKKHRLHRIKLENEKCTFTLNTALEQDAPIAFKVKEYNQRYEEYRSYNGKLWRKLYWNERSNGKKGLFPVRELVENIIYKAKELPYGCHEDRIIKAEDKILSRECRIQEIINFIDKHLIIDLNIYVPVGEPRYVINTFGLGHNHGGTALFIHKYYNSNIPNKSYFPADKRKEAISYGKKVAKNRGDSKSISRMGKSCNIIVLMPELIKCDPSQQHDE